MAKKSQTEEVLSQANESTDTTSPENGTPVYELGYHIVPTVGDEALNEVVESIRSHLSGVEIISDQFPERMTLAYVIERSVQGKREKYESSYFGWIKFSVEKEKVAAFSEYLRTTSEVLRYLIISTVREDVAPKRAVFSSNRLEGETIKKPESTPEAVAEVSEEELDKSIDALVSEETK